RLLCLRLVRSQMTSDSLHKVTAISLYAILHRLDKERLRRTRGFGEHRQPSSRYTEDCKLFSFLREYLFSPNRYTSAFLPTIYDNFLHWQNKYLYAPECGCYHAREEIRRPMDRA